MPVKKLQRNKKRKKSPETSSFPKCSRNTTGIDPFWKKRPPLALSKICSNNDDKGGVPRILSPFNRFAKKCPKIADRKLNKLPYQSTYRSSGLSPKEKSYIICSCQARSSQYMKLKTLASKAVEESKIFSVYGNCKGSNTVRKELLERGWVEKIPANLMNLSKIRNGTISSKTEIYGELEKLLLSNLVEKYTPNFVWKMKDLSSDDNTTIDMSKENTTMVNKLKIDALWTSKQGLCSSIKRNYWFYIKGIAEVNSPRTYNSYEYGETEGFVKDYKITACTSLLKWVLSMTANDKPIFIETGRISINIVLFALNRCKEYLFQKQNMDIDHPASNVTSVQWNAFLKKYYRIIAKEDVFEADQQSKLPLYLGYAKILLKEIYKYRPQLSCEGCHNIWIIKPAHCSRGRGIRMASKLGVITNLLNNANAKYVIQKYIEEPLLIHDTKFDIRQYYLVTSTYPLVIWMYTDCYLKFSSQKYSLKNYHESIHLTNNAVQKKYKNFLGRHSELPHNNMWDLDTYKKYLKGIGMSKVWDNVIYQGMKKSIVGIMLSCQDSLTVSKNRFELYGCDFILDKEYKPWLIEINSCPDLNPTTQVTGKICPAVVSDIIKVVIDYVANPKSPTGKFECIYQQPMTLPRYGRAANLYVRGYSLPHEYFYKGNMKVCESYEDPDICKIINMKSVLNKLKHYYDSDIMGMPELEQKGKNIEENMSTDDANSKNELNIAVTAITDQMEDLLDKITSNNLRLRHTEENPSSPINQPYCPVQETKSITDLNYLLRKSSSRFIIDTKKSFSFSKLDDGPWGKASYIDIDL